MSKPELDIRKKVDTEEAKIELLIKRM